MFKKKGKNMAKKTTSSTATVSKRHARAGKLGGLAPHVCRGSECTKMRREAKENTKARGFSTEDLLEYIGLGQGTSKTTSKKKTTAKKTAKRKTTSKAASVKATSRRAGSKAAPSKATSKKAGIKTTASNKTGAKSAPSRATATKKAAPKKATVKKAAPKRAVAKKAAPKELPLKKLLLKEPLPKKLLPKELSLKKRLLNGKLQEKQRKPVGKASHDRQKRGISHEVSLFLTKLLNFPKTFRHTRGTN